MIMTIIISHRYFNGPGVILLLKPAKHCLPEKMIFKNLPFFAKRRKLYNSINVTASRARRLTLENSLENLSPLASGLVLCASAVTTPSIVSAKSSKCHCELYFLSEGTS